MQPEPTPNHYGWLSSAGTEDRATDFIVWDPNSISAVTDTTPESSSALLIAKVKNNLEVKSNNRILKSHPKTPFNI